VDGTRDVLGAAAQWRPRLARHDTRAARASRRASPRPTARRGKGMPMLRITRDDGNIHTMYRADLPPLATVQVGDQLVGEPAHPPGTYKRVLTEDDLIEALPIEKVNPLTGPIAVDGARPGDTVVVRIDDVEVGDRGDCPLIPRIGLMQEHLHAPYMRI